MMNKLHLILLCFLFTFHVSNAQKELWGVNSGPESSIGYFGNITKYDINGENPAIIHEFDSIHGYRPKGKLFLASNGKLYGTTIYGGNLGAEGSNTTAGVLFEYDLVLNKYRIVKYFQTNTTAYNPVNPSIGVIEPVTGQLYGAVQNIMFKYDIATETTTFYNGLPLNLLIITTEFIKAADGNLYSTAGYGFCVNGTTPLWNGCIIKFNMATNVLSVVHPHNCSAMLEGNYPLGLIESSPNILHGITMNGGIYMQQVGGAYNAAGVLFEYNISTDQFTKKIDFNGLTIGGNPSAIIKTNDGKIYGLCQEGGVPPNNTNPNPSNFRGSLYEYTPSTNLLVVKRYFDAGSGNLVRNPTSLIKTSLGHFVGTIPNSALFRWNAGTNTITMPDYSNVTIDITNAINNSNLIEICRKPSYQEITVNSFDACAGSTFTYNIQNSNATTYQWMKNGGEVAGQNSGILSLVNVGAADAGTYTLVMTNECGTTTTMPLSLTVNCLGVNQVATLQGAIKVYPNPAKHNLTIELPSNIDVEVTSITIFNLLGQTVLKDKGQNNQTLTIPLDISRLENGIYIISLQTNVGDWNGKFIKE